MTSADSHPSRVRYRVVALATAMAVLLYLDRICLSLLERYIREDLNLSNNQASLLLAVFFVAYAVGQVPAGWLSDRYGARAMLALYILSWSLFTGLMGLVGGFGLLLWFRFGCGLAQAGAYPTSAGITSKWMPFAARARASSIIATGGRIGGFAAQVLTAYLLIAFVPLSSSSLLAPRDLVDPDSLVKALQTSEDIPAGRLIKRIRQRLESISGTLDPRDVDPLLAGLNRLLDDADLYQEVNLEELDLPPEAYRLGRLPAGELTPAQIERRNRLLLETLFPEAIRKIHGAGWRPTLLTYGLAGLVVAGLFFAGVRNRPQDHPRCNAAEVQLIEEGRLAASPHGRVGAIPWGLLVRSGNLWLSSISQLGTNFGWAFLITLLPRYLAEVHKVPVVQRGWLAGLPLLVGMAGMLAGGWLTDRLTLALGLRWGRRWPMAATRFLAMAAYLACLVLDSPLAATAAFCAVAVATDFGTASVWAFNQDIGGRHVGSVLGWGNMWGSLGAALSPVTLNYFVSQGGWNAAFLACAVAFFLSGLAALWVDATVALNKEEYGLE